MQCVLKKVEDTGQVEEQVARLKLSTADEQNLKVISLRSRKEFSKDLRDASGSSADPSTVQ